MRSIAVVLLVASLLTACDAAPSPTTAPPAPTTTETTAPEQTVSLAYSFQPGETLAYEIDFSRRLRLTTEGGGEGPLTELPASADVTLTGTGVFSFQVSDGPRPGTYRLVIDGEPDQLTVEGTVDEEPVDDVAALDALGGAMTVPEELVVDRTGSVLTDEAGASVELIPPVMGTSGLLGPVWPEGEVGEEWSFAHADRALGSVEIERTVTGRITGRETMDGSEALVIQGGSEAEQGEVDLSDFYGEFLTSFGEHPRRPTLDVEFRPREYRWTAWYDPEEGRLLSADTESSTLTRVEGTAPDRTTGDLLTFELRLETQDAFQARMVAPPEA